MPVSWTCVPHAGVPEGADCDVGADCQDGLECTHAADRGLCLESDTPCETAGDCGLGDTCVSRKLPVCVPRCESDADCPDDMPCTSYSVIASGRIVEDVYAVCAPR